MSFGDIYLYGVIAAFSLFGATLLGVSIWSRSPGRASNAASHRS